MYGRRMPKPIDWQWTGRVQRDSSRARHETAVPDLLNALDAADVPFRSADAELVLDRPVASGLTEALHVIDYPGVNRALMEASKPGEN
jgi:hypothetical protein